MSPEAGSQEALLGRADANPTKSFFVRMLTRDIALEDCILDLIDNSLDGAWRQAADQPTSFTESDSLKKYNIRVDLGPSKFVIMDNCGGIPLLEAQDYAFSFGRKELEPTEEFSVGVYGIGMKRAVFKLGREIRIRSTYTEGDDGDAASFEVPIKVDDWLESEEWNFPILASPPLDEPGVRIEVSALTSETERSLSSPTYAQALRGILARDYLLALLRGLNLYVNDVKVQGWQLGFRQNDDFAPLRSQYVDETGVRVELLAGMTTVPSSGSDPDETVRGNAEDGWYVVCNGRTVLAADKTTITGWGDTTPRWHPQYSGFVGIALFSSADPSALPMTTTKRSVDVSAAVFQRARARMAEPMRAWITYTNARKTQGESARTAETQTKVIPLPTVPERPTISLPRIAPAPRERIANVNYSVPLSRMRALADALGSVNKSYRDVGLESFEFAYNELVDED